MHTEYDEVPYMGRVHQQTHIEAIATIAILFGLETPDIQHCRVLELGCGDGSNLMSMAYNLPDAYFLGIDFSTTHIERGKRMAQDGGVHNIELIAGNIDTLQLPDEPFDFIICHGVFSWVKDATRKRILDICKNNLSQFGMAYISYNTLPGWRMHSIIRDMMQYHSARMDSTQDKIDQARAVVQFVGDHVLGSSQSTYGRFVQEQVGFISRISGEYLYHEYLESENTAFYFHEFITMLQAYDLQYLGETDLMSMIDMHYPPETRNILNEIAPNIYHLEQYMDFLRNRRFRCSLIVGNHRNFKREITPEPFKHLYIAYHAFPKGSKEPDNASAVEEKDLNESLSGIVLRTEESDEMVSITETFLYNEALSYLHHQWPRAIHFEELIHYCAKKKGREISQVESNNLSMLIQTLLLDGLLTVHAFQAPLASHISETPAVSPMARFQASHQNIICSQKHDMVAVKDPWVRKLIQLLDGSRNISQLVNSLLDEYFRDNLPDISFIDSDLPEGEQEIDAKALPREILVEKMSIRVEEILQSLLENGVLIH